MTKQLRFLLGCAAAALSVTACSKSPASPVQQADNGRSPLYDNLGSHHYPITTASPDAQKYFDQGLTLSYAFNHDEAIRAFRQAPALDPNTRRLPSSMISRQAGSTCGSAFPTKSA